MKPILFTNVSLFLPHKVCFSPFSASVPFGQKIGILGNNGAGKSTLLQMISGTILPSTGTISRPSEAILSYVPQLPGEDLSAKSGSERFNHALSQALALSPDILLLDEPTNHLDPFNRHSLLNLLQRFRGTLFVISHDVELLTSVVDGLWPLENGKLIPFSGTYDAFLHEKSQIQEAHFQKKASLEKEEKHLHLALSHEQKRVAQSRRIHSEENDRALRGKMKETASHTAGKNKRTLNQVREKVKEARRALPILEKIQPKFYLQPSSFSRRDCLSISNGTVRYNNQGLLLSEIFFSLGAREHVALVGRNSSGKTTLFKALRHDLSVVQEGSWTGPAPSEIGYLDQHYRTLNKASTPLKMLEEVAPAWSRNQLRAHLNDFLFRKNEEVNALIHTLSGGEHARLCLALIAVRPPKLLLLDEISNNLDLTTREHIIQILRTYPGPMIIISHDAAFLEAIEIKRQINVEEWKAPSFL